MTTEEAEIAEQDAADIAEEIEKPVTPLKRLHNTQISIERLRIQMGNRIGAIKRGDDDMERPVPAIFDTVFKTLVELEDRIESHISEELETFPVWNYWLKDVCGIGEGLAGQLLAMLHTPTPEKGPSSWYKAAGLVPEQRPDGTMRMPRPRAGEGRITYHPRLRQTLYNVATSFVRNGRYYRKAYEDAKERLQKTRTGPEWTPFRIDRSARWITIRLFLSHLWEMWCEAEGIHNRGPFGLTVLADGTKVIRIANPDGSYRDHAFEAAPRKVGKYRI